MSYNCLIVTLQVPVPGNLDRRRDGEEDPRPGQEHQTHATSRSHDHRVVGVCTNDVDDDSDDAPFPGVCRSLAISFIQVLFLLFAFV